MDLTTIIFGLLAIFVIWKLRSVLGTRTGHEQPPFEAYRRNTPETPEEKTGSVLRFPQNQTESEPGADTADRMADRRASWVKIPGVEERVLPGLEAIAAADPDFEPRSFIDGAKMAYEMIIMSFAAGNRNALRELLAKDVFDSFAAAIAQRESRGETVDTTFVSIDRASVEDAHLRGHVAQVTMRFDSKLITATRDRAGVVVDGDADKVVSISDVWTFAREADSRDPNWKLVATEAGA